MKFSKARARIKVALAVLCGRGQEAFSEYAKRRAVDDFLRDAGLNIPGAWNPITSVEEYEEAAEKIERNRRRQALIQALRDKYTDKDGNVSGIKIGLAEQAVVALTVNRIKPPAELSDRLFQQYKRLFEHLARYLDEIKEDKAPGRAEKSACLYGYTTAQLVEELKQREGVKTTIAEPYQDVEIKVNGPAIVLTVVD